MGTPYLTEDFPTIQNYICAFSNATVSEINAARALFGEIPIPGHLPVNISNACIPKARIEHPDRSRKYGIVPLDFKIHERAGRAQKQSGVRRCDTYGAFPPGYRQHGNQLISSAGRHNRLRVWPEADGSDGLQAIATEDEIRSLCELHERRRAGSSSRKQTQMHNPDRALTAFAGFA